MQLLTVSLGFNYKSYMKLKIIVNATFTYIQIYSIFNYVEQHPESTS